MLETRPGCDSDANAIIKSHRRGEPASAAVGRILDKKGVLTHRGDPYLAVWGYQNRGWRVSTQPGGWVIEARHFNACLRPAHSQFIVIIVGIVIDKPKFTTSRVAGEHIQRCFFFVPKNVWPIVIVIAEYYARVQLLVSDVSYDVKIAVRQPTAAAWH